MNEKINLSEIILSLQNEFTKTNDIKKAIENILIQNVDGIKDYADTEKIISELVKSIEPILTIQDIDENCNLNNILENTLNQFEHTFEDETIDIFKNLIQYDKTMIVNDTKVFSNIYTILKNLYLHKISIQKLNELENENSENRGIAKTKVKINEAIQPRLNAFKNANKYNKIPSNELSHELNAEFEQSPREINAMFEVIDTKLLKNIDNSLLETFDNQHQFLNSSETIEDTHIFKSAQIYCFTPFKIKLTNKKLAEYTNQIVNDFFEYDYNSNLNRNHISKPIQHKTYFNQLAILEFQTPKNIKEHPIFD